MSKFKERMIKKNIVDSYYGLVDAAAAEAMDAVFNTIAGMKWREVFEQAFDLNGIKKNRQLRLVSYRRKIGGLRSGGGLLAHQYNSEAQISYRWRGETAVQVSFPVFVPNKRSECVKALKGHWPENQDNPSGNLKN